MKRIRMMLFGAVLAIGGFVAPQTASAYKYYIHCGDNTIVVYADNVEDAEAVFDDLCDKGVFGGGAYLSKRPKSKAIRTC